MPDDDQGAVPPPPAPTELVGETTLVETAGPRLRWIAAFVAVVGLIVGLVVVLGGGDDTDPDKALAAAQAFLDDAESYRFELRETIHTQTGDPGGAGSESTERSVTRGAIAADDTWTLVEESSSGMMDGPYSYETRRVGDRLYSTDGFDEDESASPPWSVSPIAEVTGPTEEDYVEMYTWAEEDASDEDYDAADPYFAQERLQALVMAYYLPVADDPSNIERIIREAGDPAVEEQLGNGAVRLRATLPPIEALAKAAKHPIPPVDVLLDLDADRRPTLVQLEATVEGASDALEVTFSDWGAEIPVAAPGDDDIDHTPWITEEDLSRLDPAQLVAPSALPAGFELTSISVYGPFEPDDCPSLDLQYGVQADTERVEAFDPAELDEEEVNAFYESLSYLSLSVVSLSCGTDFDGEELTREAFDREVAGLPVTGDLAEGGYIDVLVGDMVVSISTTLSEAELEGLVGSLGPVDADTLSARIPEWARDPGMYGGYGPVGAPGGWMSGPPPMISSSESIAVSEVVVAS